MSTPDTVKAQLLALIGAANDVTGNADADLTSAVNSLVAGYGSGGVLKASGTITVDASAASVEIDTGLTSIDSMMVVRSEMPSEESGTWGWMTSAAGYMTNYFSYGSSVSWRYGVNIPYLSKSGGIATIKQYSASSPILPGTYKWVAYGH